MGTRKRRQHIGQRTSRRLQSAHRRGDPHVSGWNGRGTLTAGGVGSRVGLSQHTTHVFCIRRRVRSAAKHCPAVQPSGAARWQPGSSILNPPAGRAGQQANHAPPSHTAADPLMSAATTRYEEIRYAGRR